MLCFTLLSSFPSDSAIHSVYNLHSILLLHLVRHTNVQGQVQLTPQQPIKAQTGSKGIAIIFNLGAGWGWIVNATPRLLYPRQTDPLPVVRESEDGWEPQSRSARMRKNFPPPGFDPRSRNTDWAIPARILCYILNFFPPPYRNSISIPVLILLILSHIHRFYFSRLPASALW